MARARSTLCTERTESALYTVLEHRAITEPTRIFSLWNALVSSGCVPGPPTPSRNCVLQSCGKNRRKKSATLGWSLPPDLTCLFSIIFITKAPLRLIARHYAYRAKRLDVSLKPLSAIKKVRFTVMSYRRVRQTFYTQNITRKIIRAGYVSHNFTDNNLDPRMAFPIRRRIKIQY